LPVYDDSPDFFAYLFREFRRDPTLEYIARNFANVFPASTSPLLVSWLLKTLKIPGDKDDKQYVIVSAFLFEKLFQSGVCTYIDYFRVFSSIADFLCNSLQLLTNALSSQWFLVLIQASKHVNNIPKEHTDSVYCFAECCIDKGYSQAVAIILKHLFHNRAVPAGIRFIRVFNSLCKYISTGLLLDLGYNYMDACPWDADDIISMLAKAGKLDILHCSASDAGKYAQIMLFNTSHGGHGNLHFRNRWVHLASMFERVLASISEFRVDIRAMMNIVIQAATSVEKLGELVMNSLAILNSHYRAFDNYDIFTKTNIYRVYHNLILYVQDSELPEIHDRFIQWLSMNINDYPEDTNLLQVHAEYVNRLEIIGVDTESLVF
jgi:hypothetical protein